MRNIILLLLLVQIVSCSKEKAGFILEKSFGAGSAYDAEIASDTTFLIAGESDNSPLLTKTGSGSAIDINYSPDYPGRFTEVIESTAGYLLAGCSEGNIAICSIDNEGVEIWDTIVGVNPYINIARLSKYENDTYLLIGSDHPDSLNSNTFIVAIFDIDGNILQLAEAIPGFSPSITDLTVLSPYEIYVSITKNTGVINSKASVARITSEGAIIWETELYNNKDYMAGSLAIEADGGNLYVAGSTEYTGGDSDVSNSFVAALSQSGTVTWKKYLENSNVGSDLDFDSNMNLVLLNQNCLILTNITLPDASSTQQIRVLDVCDSYNTLTLGKALSISNENDYFISGSKDNKFYYALKSGDN